MNMTKLEKIFEEVFHEKAGDKDEMELMHFKEWDSMTHMFLITSIEEKYNIQIDGEEIASMRTIGNLKSILKKHGVTEI